MTQLNDMILVGALGMNDASRVKSALKARGIDVEIAVNPQSCTSGGCSPKGELWATQQDMPAIQEFFVEEQARSLEGYPHDLSVLQSVFDPDQQEATCPACSTRFATKLGECPDCGLFFQAGVEGGGCGTK